MCSYFFKHSINQWRRNNSRSVLWKICLLVIVLAALFALLFGWNFVSSKTTTKILQPLSKTSIMDVNSTSGKPSFHRSIPFDSAFKWPSYEVDLSTEVALRMAGLPARHKPINRWSELYNPIAIPECSTMPALSEKQSMIHILLIIRSAADRIKYRTAIRETFGAEKMFSLENATINVQMQTVFVMGEPAANHENKSVLLDEILAEAFAYKDLLIGSFEDSYYNSTLKFIHAINFAEKYASDLKMNFFILFLDDDFLLLPWNLVLEVLKHNASENLYTGFVINHNVYRSGKWKVTFEQYPFDVYPLFVSGGAVLLSRRTVFEFHVAIEHKKLYIFDDAYTGILAHYLGISPVPKNSQFLVSKLDEQHSPNWWRTVIVAHGYVGKELKEKYSEAKTIYMMQLDHVHIF